jgi:hypothetical protein
VLDGVTRHVVIIEKPRIYCVLPFDSKVWSHGGDGVLEKNFLFGCLYTV